MRFEIPGYSGFGLLRKYTDGLDSETLDPRFKYSGTTEILNLRGLWPQFSGDRTPRLHLQLLAYRLPRHLPAALPACLNDRFATV